MKPMDTAKQAERLITKSRIDLLSSPQFAFFGHLVLSLVPRADASLPYLMATDGTFVYYNPSMVVQYKLPVLMGVMAHEALHCALLHPFRRGSRDPMGWNIACDILVNRDVRQAGLQLPDDCIEDSKYSDIKWTAEAVFADRAQQAQNPQSGRGKPSPGSGQGTRFDDVLDAPAGKGDSDSDSDGSGQGDSHYQPPLTADDWKQKGEQAARSAKGHGTIPGSIGEFKARERDGRLDWKVILRRFIEHTVPSGFRWSPPNRRYIYRHLYLPSAYRENIGELAIFVDTSGSISDGLLATFAGEQRRLQSETKPDKITVIYCDTRVTDTQEFTEQEPFELSTRISRGGTYFQPCLDKLEELSLRPKSIIWLTDGDSADSIADPGIPILWVMPDTPYTRKPEFGEVCLLPADGNEYY